MHADNRQIRGRARFCKIYEQLVFFRIEEVIHSQDH